MFWLLIGLITLLFLATCRSLYVVYRERIGQLLFLPVVLIVLGLRGLSFIIFPEYSVDFLSESIFNQIFLIVVAITITLSTYWVEKVIIHSQKIKVALQQSENHFRLLMEQAPLGIQIFDPDGTLIQANKAWEEMWCVDKTAVIGNYNLFHDPQIAAKGLLADVKRVFAGEMIRLPEIFYDPQESDDPGRPRWITGYIYPVRNKQAQVQSIVLISDDITQEKEAEKALIESEDRWFQLVENHPEPILVSISGEIAYCNPATTKIFGTQSRQEIVGHSIFEFINEGTNQVLVDRLNMLERGEQTPPLEHRMIGLDGVARDLISFSVPIMYQGQKAAQTVYRDITKEKERQQQLRHHEQLAAVGQLSAGIAHDFNNALAVILMYSELILNHTELSAKNRKRISVIYEQANKAASLTSQILDFSRQSIIEAKPMDLLPFMQQLIGLLRSTIPDNIKLSFINQSDVDFVISADGNRMQQLFMNLAINSRDAMPNGGDITIAMNLIAQPDNENVSESRFDGDWIEITFTDSGEGISEENMAHLFEPFFTTKEPNKGTGLGLAQVYGIVSQHHGSIYADSELGLGTTFRVIFPRHLQESGYVEHFVEVPQSFSEGAGELILIVEDNQEAKKALSELLTLLNYRVVEAGNGIEALEVIRDSGSRIDLIISDVIMPDMDGEQLLVELRLRSVNLPIIMITAHPFTKKLEDLRHFGIFELLKKPIAIETLSTTLKNALHPVKNPS